MKIAAKTGSSILNRKILATLFYEPSTRTRLSFEAAMQRLGGQIISTENAGQFSSAAKGETLEDTIRVVEQYSDVIVLRHPQVGSAKEAAQFSQVPIINAGDGGGQHPTQTLLDVFTIHDELGRLDNLTVAAVGDLKHGRTIRSLCYVLGKFENVKIYFVSPPSVRMKDDIKEYLDKHGVNWQEETDLDKVLPLVDVVYATRVQKERFDNEEEYNHAKGKYILTKENVSTMKEDAIILHPLPRVDEITLEVDSDARAKYFQQAGNGLYVRMALLKMLLE